MMALVLEGDGDLRYRELPDAVRHGAAGAIGAGRPESSVPALPDGEFRETPYSGKPYVVRVAAAGVCGSDIPRAFSGGAYHYPLVMGHEFSGIITEAPEDGTMQQGTRVAIFPLLPCGICEACVTGNYARCSDYDYFGSRRDGGFREYVTVPQFNLIPVPDDVSLLHAAMTEPCAVALHGVRRMHIEPGQVGVVIGGGPIGNMAAQWMRIAGCSPVYVVDIDPGKLKIAGQMGFIAVDGAADDPVRVIRDATAGRGADRVIEACGLPVTVHQALSVAAGNGEVVLMGNLHDTLSIPESAYTTILRRELKVLGTWNSTYAPPGSGDWHVVLRHLGKDVDVAPLISHTPDLSEGPGILSRMAGRTGTDSFNKVIFTLDVGRG